MRSIRRPSSADASSRAKRTRPTDSSSPTRWRADSRELPRNEDRMTEKETLALYEKTGALLRGHFRLTSGLHSDVYLQSALVLQHPEHAEALGAALAEPFRAAGARTVLAPAIGGILVAHEVARALGVRALFTEREEGVMK